MGSVRKRHSVSVLLLLVTIAVLNFAGNSGTRIIREEETKKRNLADEEYEPKLNIEEKTTKINTAQTEPATVFPSSAETVPQNLSAAEIIELINRKESSWKAGINKNVSKYLRGGTFDAQLDKNIRQVSTRETAILKDIPKEFDARTKWPKCNSIGLVFDQGICGACWAVSSASVMSDRVCISSKGKEKFIFSPEDIMSCCQSCKTTNNGCSGGFAYQAFKYWIKNGIVSGGRYCNLNGKGDVKGCKPYSEGSFSNGSHPKCERKCSNSAYKVSYQKDKRHGGEVYLVEGRNIKRIQSEIIRYGPVVSQMKIYEDFADYQQGTRVYKHKVGADTGIKHGVKIIGWGVEDGDPYWLVVNSWGEQWGNMGGFFKILRGYDHCDIERTIIAGATSDSSCVQNFNFYFLLIYNICFLSF